MITINNGTSLQNKNLVSLKRYKLKDGIEYLNKELDYLNYRLSLGSGMVMPFITDIHYTVSSDTQYGYNRIKKNFNAYKEEPDNTAWATTIGLNANTYNSSKLPDRIERATIVLSKLSEINKVDCVVLGGDYEQGLITSDDFKEMIEEQSNMFSKLSLKCPVMIVKGNHDANGFGSSTTEINNRSVGAQDYEEFSLKHLHLNSGIHFGESKTYGYYDNVVNKMRVIFLNTYDFDIKTNPNYAIAHQNWFIGQTQLQWLVNTALDLTGKTGWTIIVCCHSPIFHSAERSVAYNATYGDNIFKIFINFNHKGNGSISLSAPDQYNINTISYNFADKNSGGNKVLCSVCGHIHTSKLLQGFYYYFSSPVSGSGKYKKTTVNSQTVYTEIGGTISGIELENIYTKSGTTYSTYSTNRYYLSNILVDSSSQPSGYAGISSTEYRDYVNDTWTNIREALFDVLQFDLNNNKVWCHRYGIGESRYFNVLYYNNVPYLSYSSCTKTITITVKDTDNALLSNANVTIKYNGAEITATTNASGQAIFKFMPVDKCKITASCTGYTSKSYDENNINFTSYTITLSK